MRPVTSSNRSPDPDVAYGTTGRREPVPMVESGPRGSEILLVVDDDSMIRDVVSLQLAHHGYTVLTAPDGAQGLEMLLTHDEIVAVVSDVAMPGMTGPRMVQEARRQRADLPVVFMSGDVQEPDSYRSLGCQDDVFLEKPFNDRQLQVALDAALSNGLRGDGPSD